MLRSVLIDFLTQVLGSFEYKHPLRVAIDGIDAAGKTILADEIADALKNKGRSVIRASIDGFHRPRKERYRRGNLSPEGYYYDSFDNDAIKQHLLQPLAPRGTYDYRTTIFDFRKDKVWLSPVLRASPDAILLFDGVFLMRPELNEHWDLRIFVHIDFDVSLRRALSRDLELFGSKETIVERYEKRYVPGQKIYLKQAKPKRIADMVIDNNNPQNPNMTSKSNNL